MKFNILDFLDDDWFYLNEFRWDYIHENPNLTDEESLKLIQNLVMDMINEGLVELFTSLHHDGERRVVPKTEAMEIINDPESWEPPVLAKPCYELGITEAGTAEYNRLAKERYAQP